MEPEEDENDSRLESLLLKQNSPCVCAKGFDEYLLCGWQQFDERRERKREGLNRAERIPLSRKDRERPSHQASLCDGFVFRHYEDPHLYIVQYRENHSLSRVDSDVELRPVLGVNVPDPYLPNISNSSILMERVRLIEALSDYYKTAVTRSDVENIRLTGTRAETVGRKSRPNVMNSSSRPKTYESLPSINQSRTRVSETHTIAAIVSKIDRTIHDRKENPNIKKKSEKEISVEENHGCCTIDYSSASRISEENRGSDSKKGLVSKEMNSAEENGDRDQKSAELKTCLPSFLTTEATSNRNVINFRTKKKGRTFEHSSSESSDESGARKSDGTIAVGTVYTGSMVKPPSVKSNGNAGVSLGKCELFSSNQNVKQNLPDTSNVKYSPWLKSKEAFIGIFGQSTGPRPKVQGKRKETTVKEKKKVESPRCHQSQFCLPYVNHVKKRHQFHYVLHAHAYSPGSKFKAAAVADLHWK